MRFPGLIALVFYTGLIGLTYGVNVVYTHHDDRFAAQEVVRYIYASSRLRTSLAYLPEFNWQIHNHALPTESVLLLRKHPSLPEEWNLGAITDDVHLVQTLETHVKVHVLVGNCKQSILYAAYTFAEKSIGVFFQLSGDVIPRRQGMTTLPKVEKFVHRPQFEIRGLNPFHDFASGPDWWTEQDYKAVVGQMAKMKLNFLGFHTYQWVKDVKQHAGNEPLVWIGTEDSLMPDGSIKPKLPGAYPTSWANTKRAQWGMSAFPEPQNIPFGANLLFESSCYPSHIQKADSCPFPVGPEASVQVFDNAAAMLRHAFSLAKVLGVQTCVGVEVPLAKPVYQGTPAASVDYFKGIFRRIMSDKGYHIDHFWIWTPESWEWEKTSSSSSVFNTTLSDFDAALEAKKQLKADWQMATCGWVVGPLPDRSIFDKLLSTGYAAISSIDQRTGSSPVDSAYAHIQRHKKWVIPWMEDDPGMSIPQLWVNRTLLHMQAANQYGAKGVLGIHWRTGVTAPTISAMAQKSWNWSLTSETFWRQWATANFGARVGTATWKIFADNEGFKMPRPVAWRQGPGAIFPNVKNCGAFKTQFKFVQQLEAVSIADTDPAQRERFVYWLHNFQYMRSVAQFSCTWSNYEDRMSELKLISDQTLQREFAAMHLPNHRATMILHATELMEHMLSIVSNRGEQGTVSNILAKSLLAGFAKQEAEMAKYLPNTKIQELPTTYGGKCRLIVPTVRTSILSSESLQLETIVLAPNCKDVKVVLHHSDVMNGGFDSAAFVAKGKFGCVFEITVPLNPRTSLLEWYVTATHSSCEPMTFPSAAPEFTQTVTVIGGISTSEQSTSEM